MVGHDAGNFLQELEVGLPGLLPDGRHSGPTGGIFNSHFVDQLLQAGKVTVQVLPTADKWFGVTYREDKPQVAEAFRSLIAAGEYGVDLFADLRNAGD